MAGCTPTCEQVCDKLVACDGLGTERMSAYECEEQCGVQNALYADWTDGELEQDFDDHLTCLNESECDAIAGGSCYDEALFAF